MKNIKFVFAVSFCALFAASAALATAPDGDTPEEFDIDISAPHTVFTELPLAGGPSDGIAGVTYVNRAVNSAGAAATAAEAHAAAAGAYAVSAKSSADAAQEAADDAKDALDGKADKGEIKNATLTIQRNGTDVGTFTANASDPKTINIVDNDTIYTLPKATTAALGGVIVGTNLSIDGDGVLSAKDTTYSAGTNITISDDGTISATDTVYTLPTASTSTLGGVKVGANLSIDNNGVLSAKDTTYSAGTNITISEDGKISATDTVYSLPTASASVLGGVKVGANLSIDNNGVLSAILPTVDSATDATAGIGKLYGGTGENTDGAMTQKSVTEALADKADKNDIPTGDLASKDVVVSADITDGEVKTADIADGAVTEGKIADSAVTSVKIADAAVTAAKTTGIIGKVPSGSENSTTLSSIWLQ